MTFSQWHPATEFQWLNSSGAASKWHLSGGFNRDFLSILSILSISSGTIAYVTHRLMMVARESTVSNCLITKLLEKINLFKIKILLRVISQQLLASRFGRPFQMKNFHPLAQDLNRRIATKWLESFAGAFEGALEMVDRNGFRGTRSASLECQMDGVPLKRRGPPLWRHWQWNQINNRNHYSNWSSVSVAGN